MQVMSKTLLDLCQLVLQLKRVTAINTSSRCHKTLPKLSAAAAVFIQQGSDCPDSEAHIGLIWEIFSKQCFKDAQE